MTLRARLFLVLGGLLAAFLAAQAWLVRSLSAEMLEEIDSVAFRVGTSVAQVLSAEAGTGAEPRFGKVVVETLSGDERRIESYNVPKGGDTRGELEPDPHLERPSSERVRGYPLLPPPRAETGDSENAAAERSARPNAGTGSWIGHPEPAQSTVQVRVLPDPGPAVALESDPKSAPVAASEGAVSARSDSTFVVGSSSTPTGGDQEMTLIEATHRITVDTHWVTDEGEHSRVVTLGGPSSGQLLHSVVHLDRNGVSGSPGPGKEATGPGNTGGTDVRLHLASQSGTRFLLVERPDLMGRVPIPQAGWEEHLRELERRTLAGSLALLLAGLLAAAVVAHRVSAPLRRLAAAASEVGQGSLGVQVPTASGDREIRHTLAAFNHMSQQLAELDAEHRRLQSRRHLLEIADIARGLAHSLRNPLNALGLSVEELAAPGPDGDREQRLAAAARRQIRRLDHGIRSFLLLASPSDADGLETEILDVDEMVRDVALEALQQRDGGPRVEIELRDARADSEAAERTTEPGAFRLEGVAPELRAVIQALLVNALEASPENATVRIELRSSDGVGSDGQPEDGNPEGAAKRLRLEVLDRGPGLHPEVRDRLFTPHLSTKASGSGMGLFLAHRIATHCYGGKLELLERRGGGIRARLELGPRLGSEVGGRGAARGDETVTGTVP